MSILKQTTTLQSNNFKKITVALVAVAIAILAWANMIFNVNINAHAATLVNAPLAVTAEGAVDGVKGSMKEGAGTVQRNVGDAIDNGSMEAEGALKQAKGKAEQTAGSAKNRLDDAGDNIEDASEGFIESVKDFFD